MSESITNTDLTFEPMPGQITVEEAITESEYTDAGKRMSAQNKAYGKATTRLREAHREEFDALVAEEYRKVGLAFRRRRTAEEREQDERKARTERAQAALRKLLTAHPELQEEMHGGEHPNP